VSQVEAGRLPQHYDPLGMAWCDGSGRPAQAGRCPGCGTTPAGARLQDPARVLEAAVARGVQDMLAGGLPLPAAPVPLDPEPERATVTWRDAYTTVLAYAYPGGTGRRVWVTVELEDDQGSPASREAAEHDPGVSAGLTPCPDPVRHSAHAWAGGTQWCEGRP
jgi:hypothetical protein